MRSCKICKECGTRISSHASGVIGELTGPEGLSHGGMSIGSCVRTRDHSSVLCGTMGTICKICEMITFAKTYDLLEMSDSPCCSVDVDTVLGELGMSTVDGERKVGVRTMKSEL